MDAGGHFVKEFKTKKKLGIDLKWREMLKSDFRSSKIDARGHVVEKMKQTKSCELI